MARGVPSLASWVMRDLSRTGTLSSHRPPVLKLADGVGRNLREVAMIESWRPYQDEFRTAVTEMIRSA
jgi:hypothetical protein